MLFFAQFGDLPVRRALLDRFVEALVELVAHYELLVLVRLGLVLDYLLKVLRVVLVVHFDERSDGYLEYFVGVGREGGK